MHKFLISLNDGDLDADIYKEFADFWYLLIHCVAFEDFAWRSGASLNERSFTLVVRGLTVGNFGCQSSLTVGRLLGKFSCLRSLTAREV